MSWFGKWKPKIKREIGKRELRKLIKKVCPEIRSSKIILSDRDYLIPANPKKIMKKIRSWVHSYIAQKRDCDDFSRIHRGEMSKLACGNVLAMNVWISYYSESKGKTVHHAVIGFFNEDESAIVFGEPQTGKMKSFRDSKVTQIIA